MSDAPTGPIRILELRSVRGTGGGPEKTILLGAAHADPARFKVTVCYIRDLRDQVFAIDRRASEVVVDYTEVFERHSFDFRVWPALRGLVRDRSIDIVHSHDYKTNVLALALGRVGSVLPLSTVHGWTGVSWREKHVYYPVDKRILARFPRLIAVSGDIRDELVRSGARPERVAVVLNGIDPERFRRDRNRSHDVRVALGLSDADFVIGAVGRAERQKRFDILLNVMAGISRSRPNLRLVIVGDGTLLPPLESQAHALGLGPACRFLGHRSDVADLHNAFDLLVQSSEYEGTPNAVLEAMALETPIVATDAGGTRQLIDDGVHGLIVPAGDETALAVAVSRAIEDIDARLQWARAARERVEGPLSFRSRMAAVEAIYESMSGARRR